MNLHPPTRYDSQHTLPDAQKYDFIYDLNPTPSTPVFEYTYIYIFFYGDLQTNTTDTILIPFINTTEQVIGFISLVLHAIQSINTKPKEHKV